MVLWMGSVGSLRYYNQNNYVILYVYFSFFALTILIPGLATVVLRPHRAAVRNVPVAGSLSAFALAMIAGVPIYSIVCFFLEANLIQSLKGLVLSIFVFVGSFGLIFPLAIPIASSIIVFATITRSGSISRAAWGAACSIGTLGWAAAYFGGLFVFGLSGLH